MSYCRWSSDGFMCDVYVYEDCSGGWTTHVATNRVKERAPEIFVPGATPEEYRERYDKYRKHMDTVERERINLPHAGESFNDATPGECAQRLQDLKALGYNVPQYAIDALLEEELT